MELLIWLGFEVIFIVVHLFISLIPISEQVGRVAGVFTDDSWYYFAGNWNCYAKARCEDSEKKLIMEYHGIINYVK